MQLGNFSFLSLGGEQSHLGGECNCFFLSIDNQCYRLGKRPSGHWTRERTIDDVIPILEYSCTPIRASSGFVKATLANSPALMAKKFVRRLIKATFVLVKVWPFPHHRQSPPDLITYQRHSGHISHMCVSKNIFDIFHASWIRSTRDVHNFHMSVVLFGSSPELSTVSIESEMRLCVEETCRSRARDITIRRGWRLRRLVNSRWPKINSADCSSTSQCESFR